MKTVPCTIFCSLVYTIHACTVLFAIFKYPEIRFPEEFSKVPKVPDNRGLTVFGFGDAPDGGGLNLSINFSIVSS